MVSLPLQINYTELLAETFGSKFLDPAVIRMRQVVVMIDIWWM